MTGRLHVFDVSFRISWESPEDIPASDETFNTRDVEKCCLIGECKEQLGGGRSPVGQVPEKLSGNFNVATRAAALHLPERARY